MKRNRRLHRSAFKRKVAMEVLEAKEMVTQLANRF